MYLPTKYNAVRVILLPRIMEIMAQSIPTRSSVPHSFEKLQMLLGEVEKFMTIQWSLALLTITPRLYDHFVITTIFLPPKRKNYSVI